MRPGERRRPGLELGVILLLAELFNVGLGTIPKVTLFTIIGQVLLYLGVINVPWTKWDVCISAEKVLNAKDYRRFILSTFEHGDDMHLYYNMASFIIKGRTLENRYGSPNFAVLLAFLIFMTNAFYIAIAKFGGEFLEDYSMMKTCAIGFSGVLFALKVITTSETAPGTAYIMGLPVPSRYAAWVELVLIHILVPNASFMGHLAGILAGCVYTSTFIGRIIDSVISYVTGCPMFHEFRESTGRFRTGSSYRSTNHEYSNDYGGFQRGFPGNRFNGNGFGSFGPSMFQRTYTARGNEYGWRY